MKTDEASNYSTDNFSKEMWNYGEEIWCNKEGRYLHIVADLSHLSTETRYRMSLCSVGILGT